MHPYTTDTQEADSLKIFWGLAVPSIALAYVFDRALAALGWQWSWLIGAPSALGIFSILRSLFDNYLWRWPLLRKIGLIKVPDLNGRWCGEGKTSYEKQETYRAEVHIKQTWTRIRILLRTENSYSLSIAASLRGNDVDTVLTYMYWNRPLSSSPETMQYHVGTAELWLRGDCLCGEYYTGRGRKTHGTLTLRRTRGMDCKEVMDVGCHGGEGCW